MPKKEEELVGKLSDILKDKGVKFQGDMIVGGSHPDLVFVSPKGLTYVVEVKTWPPTPENQKRASNLAALYTNTSGSAGAFVVLPGQFESRIESGVISAQKFPLAVDKILSSKSRVIHSKSPEVRKRPDRSIFVAMPFSEKYDDTFVVAIEPAGLELGVDAVRVDHQHFTGDIVGEIKRLITQSIAIIADLSESRPNVLYELGYGEALKRPIIQISSTPRENLPFDVRNNKTISYKIGQSAKLKTKLTKELKAIVR